MPADDATCFGPQIGEFAQKMTGLAGSATSPAEYAKKLVARICPTTLPYQLDTPAGFDYTGFNGRGLADDVMDVMLTLATNTALGDRVAPDQSRMRSDFPYFGEAYSSAGQAVGAPPAAQKR